MARFPTCWVTVHPLRACPLPAFRENDVLERVFSNGCGEMRLAASAAFGFFARTGHPLYLPRALPATGDVTPDVFVCHADHHDGHDGLPPRTRKSLTHSSLHVMGMASAITTPMAVPPMTEARQRALPYSMTTRAPAVPNLPPNASRTGATSIIVGAEARVMNGQERSQLPLLG